MLDALNATTGGKMRHYKWSKGNMTGPYWTEFGEYTMGAYWAEL